MHELGPASELEAVNELLGAIGEDPIDELTVGFLPPSANAAHRTLMATSRDFQEEGFWFNRETDYPLVPNADGTITIPPNFLSLDGTDADVIERGSRLYDRENKSFTFSGPVSCTVILHLPWDELPAAARRYVTALATEKFVDGFPGANAVTEARHRNLLRAKVAFERAVIRNEGFNLFNNSTIQTLNRRS